jgi:putative aldouronate transport system substrate-binding protein
MNKQSLLVGVAVLMVVVAASVWGGGEPEAATEDSGRVTITTFTHANVEPFPEGLDENNNPLKDWLEERSGYNINTIIGPQENMAAKLSLMFASGDVPDLVFALDKDLFAQFVNQRVIRAIDDFLETPKGQDFLDPDVVPTYLWTAAKSEGQIYGVPIEAAIQATGGTMARTDLLEEFGYTPDGFETVEDFHAFLSDVEAAYPDMIPWTGEANNIIGGITPIAGAFDVAVTYDVESGRVVDTRTTDERREWLSYLSTLYEEGLLDQEYAVNARNSVTEKVVSGRVAVLTSGAFSFRDQINAYDEKFPGQPYTPIDPVPDSEGNSGVAAPNPLRAIDFIPADAEHPEEAFDYMHMWFTDREVLDYVSYGEEGVHYAVNEQGVKEPTDAAMKYNIYYMVYTSPQAHLDRAMIKGFWPTYQPLFKYALYRDVTGLAPYIEAAEDPRQALNDLTEESFHKIITGALPLSAFDTFVSEWEALEGQVAVDAIDAWYQSTK